MVFNKRKTELSYKILVYLGIKGKHIRCKVLLLFFVLYLWILESQLAGWRLQISHVIIFCYPCHYKVYSYISSRIKIVPLGECPASSFRKPCQVPLNTSVLSTTCLYTGLQPKPRQQESIFNDLPAVHFLKDKNPVHMSGVKKK